MADSESKKIADKNKAKFNLMSESIIIGLVTVFAYLLVFVYELSYLKYFNIPSEFISVSLEKFFIVLAGIGGVVSILYIFVDLLLFFKPKKENLVAIRIYAFLTLLLIFFAPYLYVNNFKINWRFFCLVILYAFFYFGFPLIHRDKKSYKEKLIEQDEIENAVPSLFERFVNLFGKYGGIVVSGCFYLAYLAFLSGLHDAKEQKDFVVVDINNEKFAIIRVYGDSIILSQINEEKRTFGKIFYVKNKNELSETLLENKEIGKLTKE